jgi:hypothetical protein
MKADNHRRLIQPLLRARKSTGLVAARLALVSFLTGLVVALLFLAPPASAAQLLHVQTRVAAIAEPAGQFVGPHSSVLAVQGRERTPNYDQSATGSSVAADDGAGALARLDQDVGVNPSAPDALSLERQISLSDSQNEFLQGRIGDLQEQGATDFRVNQQQVDINGDRVGINRPDLQYTLNGQRFYEEFETGSLEAALEHGPRILANDPSGQFVPWFVR